MAPFKRSHYVTPRTIEQAFGPHAEFHPTKRTWWESVKLEFWRMYDAITK